VIIAPVFPRVLGQEEIGHKPQKQVEKAGIRPPFPPVFGVFIKDGMRICGKN
jgi:hypothetical protein